MVLCVVWYQCGIGCGVMSRVVSCGASGSLVQAHGINYEKYTHLFDDVPSAPLSDVTLCTLSRESCPGPGVVCIWHARGVPDVHRGRCENTKKRRRRGAAAGRDCVCVDILSVLCEQSHNFIHQSCIHTHIVS